MPCSNPQLSSYQLSQSQYQYQNQNQHQQKNGAVSGSSPGIGQGEAGSAAGSAAGSGLGPGWRMSASPLLLPNAKVDKVDLDYLQLQPESQAESSRSSTLPIPNSGRTLPSGSSSLRPKKLRSRTSTMSAYTPPLPPVMSRENSAEDVRAESSSAASGGRPIGNPADIVAQLSRSLDPGPSQYLTPSSSFSSDFENGQPVPRLGRRASKSVSGSRPTVIITPAKRTQSYYTPQLASSSTLPGSPLPLSPEVGPNTVKRRTSTPTLVRRFTTKDEEIPEENERDDRVRELMPEAENNKGKGKGVESRARSTSTSVVVPQTMGLTENSTFTLPQLSYPPSSSSSTSHRAPSPAFRHAPTLPPSAEAWPEMHVSPPSYATAMPDDQTSITPTTSALTSAYNIGESSFMKLIQWVKPRRHQYDNMAYRRGSEDSSEKGLHGSDEDDTVESEARASDESARRPGQHWGTWGSEDREERDRTTGVSGYFSLPPTPPDELNVLRYPEFGAALNVDSLPTPALSTVSLSRGDSKKNKLRKAFRHRQSEGGDHRGWLTSLWSVWRGYKGGKTAEVLKELGWTVSLLVATFFVTGAIALWLIKGMPITTLKHIPQSTTDLQLLSAEIRSYMASSDAGWWHTVGVLFFVGCWKHAWSVPGAVVLNILVGSLLDPMPALALLTLITATGSLGAYTLSRPLAPLIAVLFPKPLALVRAALAPESVPTPPSAYTITNETVTPIQVSSDPSARPIGGPTEKTTVWRRLLIMRAMGFVPWSGMNVACGVVGVDWKTFWLTTAAGSASWSYVTASVGHILSRLKVPAAALASSAGEASEEMMSGESLTSLLRDPVLIAKMVFLSGLTLLPVILKRRGSNSSESSSSSPITTTSATMSNVTSFSSSEGTTPRSSSSFELSDMHHMGLGRNGTAVHPAISSLRLDLDGTSGGHSSHHGSPMSPLSQSLATFTPTPRMFDLLSFGRSAVRQVQRALGASVRGVGRAVRGTA